MRLQQQLQDTRAALLSSRSHADSARALAAEAVAEEWCYKARLHQMSASADEMYRRAVTSYDYYHNQREMVVEELYQERASRVQEVHRVMSKVDSLTAEVASSQVRRCNLLCLTVPNIAQVLTYSAVSF